MALWGNKDTVYSSGKVNCNANGVVTRHSGTIDWTANGVKVGQVLTLATDGAGPGQGIIQEIVSNHEIKLDTQRLDLPGTFSDVDYEIRETPKYEVRGGSFGINEIFGVDPAEQEEARDDKSKYRPAHAGWVGIQTYIQNNADGSTTLRVKTETLVAGSTITGDSNDDTVLPDN